MQLRQTLSSLTSSSRSFCSVGPSVPSGLQRSSLLAVSRRFSMPHSRQQYLESGALSWLQPGRLHSGSRGGDGARGAGA